MRSAASKVMWVGKMTTKAILAGLRGYSSKATLAVLGAMVVAIVALAAGSAWAGVVHSNGGVIDIPNRSVNPLATSGPANPYPSTINVSGMPQGRGITDLNVTLRGISHTYPEDLDILLVGPGGQKVMLMSDAGGNFDLNNATLTFDDEPPSRTTLPDSGDISELRYQPTNYIDFDFLPAPAPAEPPAEPYATSLSAFDGINPNGQYKLYVFDDQSTVFGQMTGGWSLDITAAAPNDNFSSAHVINSSAASVAGDNLAASYESGEPNPRGNGSVWYRWTAPGTGATTVDTCTSNFDTYMVRYTGSSVSSLTQDYAANGGCQSGLGDRTTFTAQIGTTYNFQVQGLSPPTQGTFTLNLAGPPNEVPTITPLSPAPSSRTRNRAPLISAKVTDTATNLAASDIRLFVDSQAKPFTYDQGTDTLSHASRLSYGSHTVRIEATDGHQGQGSNSWSFRVLRRR